MCNICEKNASQMLEGLSSELKFLMNEVNVIECVISDIIANSNKQLKTKHVVSLQKIDQIIQTIEALSKFTMNVSKTDLSITKFQEEIEKIHLESIRKRIGPSFGGNKSDEIDIGKNQVEFFD